MTLRNEVFVNTAPREATLTRVINAPRELVFRAWTEAEHLAKWFAPGDFTAAAESDPRKGGKYRITMYGPKDAPPEMKGPFPITGEYIEFMRPERLVMSQDVSEHPDDWKESIKNAIQNYSGEDFLRCVMAVTFEPLGEKTKLTFTTTFSTDGVRDAYMKTGMEEGWALTLEKLEALVAK